MRRVSLARRGMSYLPLPKRRGRDGLTMRESKIEAHFVRSVALSGGMVRKAQWIGRSGCPDRFCAWPVSQRSAWVELKGDGGKLSVMQVREIDRLRQCGEDVRVLRSIEAVDAFVEEVTK